MLPRTQHRLIALFAVLCAGNSAFAQAPARPTAPAQPGGGFGRSAYPQRPPADPAVLERGQGLYSVNCRFCHGSDARGGEGGPNLLRSTIVLNDQSGEGITPVVRNGRPDRGMPAFSLTASQISDIATFLHSFPVGGRDVPRNAPASIVVGDSAAGKTYFEGKCSRCHSASGDMKDFVAHTQDPKVVQQTWLMPGGGRGASAVKLPPTTVSLTFTDGNKVEGRLEKIDDFLVTLRDSNGNLRSYPRSKNNPAVEIHDPLQPHLDLLSEYNDKNIHDVTAYLVTLR
jgi:cytochrome c oxidase cbb3-type subunit III